MKNIIISPKIILDKNNQVNFSLEKNWIDYFYSKNINLISIYQFPIQVGKLKLLKPAGLILHGGNDIYFNKKDKINILRKKMDNELLKFALRKKIPILGVCFGFQFIADFYGVKMSYSSKHAKTKHNIDIGEFIKNKKKRNNKSKFIS